jgi:hypothetical protein
MASFDGLLLILLSVHHRLFQTGNTDLCHQAAARANLVRRLSLTHPTQPNRRWQFLGWFEPIFPQLHHIRSSECIVRLYCRFVQSVKY